MLKNGLIALVSLVVTWAAHADKSFEESELTALSACGENKKAQLLAKLVKEDPDQLRSSLSCNQKLTSIAQQKAEEMAEAGEVSHHGVGGYPDQRLIEGGYNLKLPEGVGLEGNHVEAVQGGSSRAEDILSKFKNSYQHRVHLFGEHSFFLEQDEIGVGYAYNWNSPHVDYWVVYIASRAEPENGTE
ncbi:CAP domain-containing protein [Kangiella taiwanensis]|uniref:SCP domain-containing protein n=1 Tax=Kangiella taiwanensis TaxID=1079179 RepID=A0ABP8HZE7_9GAMM|nr:CAP domain-containing protein [Kangiella taiwanensis]